MEGAGLHFSIPLPQSSLLLSNNINIVEPDVFDAHGKHPSEEETPGLARQPVDCQTYTTFPLVISSFNKCFCTVSVCDFVRFVNISVLNVNPGFSSLHPATTIYLYPLFVEVEAQRNSNEAQIMQER